MVALIHILCTGIFWAYTLWFHAKHGQTPGKKLMRVRIIRLDGARIGWTEALNRSSVDIAMGLIGIIGLLIALSQISAGEYAALAAVDKGVRMKSLTPAWINLVNDLTFVWILSEFVVMMFNRRRRAIHDFIGGTVVVRDPAPAPAPPLAAVAG